MATRMIYDSVASYLVDLTATNEICDTLGTTFTKNKNLFLYFEPRTATDCITLIPYPGGPPETDNQRQNPSVQIRVRTSTRQKCIELGQALINVLNMNQLGGKGLVKAVNSAPMPMPPQEGEEFKVSVVSFDLKHVKL